MFVLFALHSGQIVSSPIKSFFPHRGHILCDRYHCLCSLLYLLIFSRHFVQYIPSLSIGSPQPTHRPSDFLFSFLFFRYSLRSIFSKGQKRFYPRNPRLLLSFFHYFFNQRFAFLRRNMLSYRFLRERDLIHHFLDPACYSFVIWDFFKWFVACKNRHFAF